MQGDVRWLADVIAIDTTLAGLFRAMASDEDVIARLIRKTLYIGVFAFIIGDYNNLAQIIYNSFAGLGIEAGGGTMSARPIGIDAGKPILTAISGMMGFTGVFANLVQIVTLLSPGEPRSCDTHQAEFSDSVASTLLWRMLGSRRNRTEEPPHSSAPPTSSRTT